VSGEVAERLAERLAVIDRTEELMTYVGRQPLLRSLRVAVRAAAQGAATAAVPAADVPCLVTARTLAGLIAPRGLTTTSLQSQVVAFLIRATREAW
jgi:CTP:molybdopterin cytidylyltransferase MocA